MQNPELDKAIQFVMKRATQPQLEMLRQAIDSRLGVRPATTESLDFKDMAAKTISGLKGKYSAGTADQVHEMTKRMVAGMLRSKEPNLSEMELEILIEKMVPNPQKAAQGQETGIPKDILFQMISQFSNFAIGEMPDKELKDLKESLPEWPQKYWDIFSNSTKGLIRDLIEGKLPKSIFISRIREQIYGKP